ncbi:Pentatricopeptide repeat-containing protein [Forsythia ovata]|uniref:Pentatricopeptide repeat-containing protein n=1 Tax=Forsythia ovata TaxID=205694 RepID=A0ABD1WQE9_9LAMI
MFLINLLENRSKTERVLESVKAKLDAPCISEVLKRCVVDEPQLGLRFFIWSGLHPTYRHSSYMYSKACKLLGLEKNPSIVVDVISAYRDENSVVSVKMFKVVLNLCRAAKDEKLGL